MLKRTFACPLGVSILDGYDGLVITSMTSYSLCQCEITAWTVRSANKNAFTVICEQKSVYKWAKKQKVHVFFAFKKKSHIWKIESTVGGVQLLSTRQSCIHEVNILVWIVNEKFDYCSKKKNRAKSRSLQIKKIYWIEERNANPEQNNNKEKYVKRVHADINRSFPLRVQRVHVISSWSRSPSNVAHPSVSRFLHGLTIVDYVRVHVLYVWITHVKWCTSTRLSAVSILFFCFSLYVRFI